MLASMIDRETAKTFFGIDKIPNEVVKTLFKNGPITLECLELKLKLMGYERVRSQFRRWEDVCQDCGRIFNTENKLKSIKEFYDHIKTCEGSVKRIKVEKEPVTATVAVKLEPGTWAVQGSETVEPPLTAVKCEPDVCDSRAGTRAEPAAREEEDISSGAPLASRTRDKPFVCEICPARFRRPDRLRRHRENVHTGGAPLLPLTADLTADLNAFNAGHAPVLTDSLGPDRSSGTQAAAIMIKCEPDMSAVTGTEQHLMSVIKCEPLGDVPDMKEEVVKCEPEESEQGMQISTDTKIKSSEYAEKEKVQGNKNKQKGELGGRASSGARQSGSCKPRKYKGTSMNKSSKEDGRSELSLSAKEILDKAFANQEIVNSDDKTALNSPWLPSDWSINIDSSAAEVCFTHRRSALEARPSMLRNVPCPYCGRVVKYRHNLKTHIAAQHSAGGLEAVFPLSPDRTLRTEEVGQQEHNSSSYSEEPLLRSPQLAALDENLTFSPNNLSILNILTKPEVTLTKK